MAKFPTYEEMGKKVAEKALDEFLYDGKSIREWMQIIASEDAISRKAVLKIIDGWYEQNRDTDNIEDLIVLITYMDSVNPQKPKSECEHDHEILKAYSDGASAVLDKVRAEIDGLLNDEDNSMYAHGVMDCLEIIDKYAEEGKA